MGTIRYMGDWLDISFGGSKQFRDILDLVRAFKLRTFLPATSSWKVIIKDNDPTAFMKRLNAILSLDTWVIKDSEGNPIGQDDFLSTIDEQVNVKPNIYDCRTDPNNPFLFMVRMADYDSSGQFFDRIRKATKDYGGWWSSGERWNRILVKSPEMADTLGDMFNCPHITNKIKERLEWNLAQQKEMRENTPYNLPFKPMPWQTVGIDFILKNKRVILGDEVGLGKTAEALGALHVAGAKRILVIIPAHLRDSWKHEIKKFMGDTPQEILLGETPHALTEEKIYIISYNLLGAWRKELIGYKPQAIIFDEIHYIKGSTYKKASKRAVESSGVVLKTNPEYIIGLSGSVVVNTPDDIWNIIEKVQPLAWMPPNSAIGWNYFSNNFLLWEKHGKYSRVAGKKNAIRLNEELTATVFLMRKQSDVGLFFDQIDIPEYLTLDEKEKMSAWAGNEAFSIWASTGEAKKRAVVEWIRSWVTDNPDKKLVVWGQHNSLLRAVNEDMPNNSILVIGSTDAHKAVQEFKTDATKHIILIGYEKGVEGINGLQEVSHNMVFAELPMTYTRIAQAKGRIRRIGQEQTGIFYYYLIADGTFEDRLLSMLKKKEEMAMAIVEGREGDGVMADISENLSHYLLEWKKQKEGVDMDMKKNPQHNDGEHIKVEEGYCCKYEDGNLIVKVERAYNPDFHYDRGGVWFEVEKYEGRASSYTGRFYGGVGGKQVMRTTLILKKPYYFEIPDDTVEGMVPLLLYKEVTGKEYSKNGLMGSRAEKKYAKYEREISSVLSGRGYDSVVLYYKTGVHTIAHQVFLLDDVLENPRKREFTEDKLWSSGNISVVVGRRGSGKTAFGFSILEKAHNAGKLTYIVSAPPTTVALLPDWVKNIKDISMAPDDSVVMVDEAVLTYSNREWTRDKSAKLNSVIDLARHKNISLIFITLNSAMIEVNIIRTIDTLILKEPSLLQIETERPFMKKFLVKADEMFNTVPQSDDPRSWAAIFDTNEETMLKTDLPELWSDQLSTSWGAFSGEVQTEEDGTVPKSVKPVCTTCRHWVYEEDSGEAWCILGHNVPKLQCDDYEDTNKSKKVVKVGKKRK